MNRARTYPPRRPRKYRLSYLPMTRAEALAIRTAHLEGRPVLALELQEACRILSRVPEPKKLRLPELPRPEKERINAVLIYKLAFALGRIEERKVA